MHASHDFFLSTPSLALGKQNEKIRFRWQSPKSQNAQAKIERIRHEWEGKVQARKTKKHLMHNCIPVLVSFDWKISSRLNKIYLIEY